MFKWLMLKLSLFIQYVIRCPNFALADFMIRVLRLRRWPLLKTTMAEMWQTQHNNINTKQMNQPDAKRLTQRKNIDATQNNKHNTNVNPTQNYRRNA